MPNDPEETTRTPQTADELLQQVATILETQGLVQQGKTEEFISAVRMGKMKEGQWISLAEDQIRREREHDSTSSN